MRVISTRKLTKFTSVDMSGRGHLPPPADQAGNTWRLSDVIIDLCSRQLWGMGCYCCILYNVFIIIYIYRLKLSRQNEALVRKLFLCTLLTFCDAAAQYSDTLSSVTVRVL